MYSHHVPAYQPMEKIFWPQICQGKLLIWRNVVRSHVPSRSVFISCVYGLSTAKV